MVRLAVRNLRIDLQLLFILCSDCGQMIEVPCIAAAGYLIIEQISLWSEWSCNISGLREGRLHYIALHNNSC